MNRTVPALVVLTARERALFFPGALEKRLRALLPTACYFNPEELNANWHKIMRTSSPEIIVSSWSTPLIPADLPPLRYVCHTGGSIRHFLPRLALERGVLVTNWGTTLSETVAEAALSMTLAALRRTQHFGEVMHRGLGWEQSPAGTLSLFERRVGIHGFGAISRCLVPLLRPFRTPIRVFSEHVPDSELAKFNVERAQSLEDLFGWADILIELAALTLATQGMVTADLLGRLRPGSIFVNVGRGKVVDEDALYRIALKSGVRIALDVYRAEPLPRESPLRGLDDVTLFPHVAGLPADRIALAGELALRNLEHYMRGEELEAVFTTEMFDRST